MPGGAERCWIRNVARLQGSVRPTVSETASHREPARVQGTVTAAVRGAGA